ncbi:MAG: putative CXXCH cytochrome family protein [Planctomycetota bacterium]|jgi:predicted CXXCH cytochrome family protein
MRRVICIIAFASIAMTSGAFAEDPKIAARSLSPKEIANYGLPEGTQKSAGLFTVGIGEPIYLDALVLIETESTGVSWTLAGPGGSSAALEASPLGLDIPVYGPGDQAVYKLGDRRMLLPDIVGVYTVTAVVSTADGDSVLTVNITGATYVGVGGIAGAVPGFPQCALCHSEEAATWSATGHATAFTRQINGEGSEHYNGDCNSCHTTGFNAAAGAVNGGFDDVAVDVGWTFPEELVEGNWEAMDPALQAMGNIQCESCHGPGSEHAGNPATISTSLSAGDCAQCHDAEPYHLTVIEWEQSKHAIATRYPTGEGRESCVGCHSGAGFVQRIKHGEITDPAWEAIGCQVCHDPHSAENPHQLRRVDDVTLMNGEVVTAGGNGKICMNCHISRRDADTYTEQYSGHFGPHHGPQTDMLVGTNAVEYDQNIASSPHLFALENACATCHMAGVEGDDPSRTHAGGHTFRPVFDNGTPDDPSDDVDLTATCVACHGEIDSFDIPTQDYDGDGTVEGVQSEVEGLMHALAMELPPIGEPMVEVTEEYTPAELKASYNYLFVEEDGSMGVHNTRYAVGILKESFKDLTGREIDTAVETEAVAALPSGFELAQNSPNPFNPNTQISYAVAGPADVRLTIYNSIGQKVRLLVEAHHAAGQYRVNWDGRDNSGRQLTAGIYLYVMEAGSFREAHKMVLLP